MTPLNSDRIAEIAALAAKATPGPWEAKSAAFLAERFIMPVGAGSDEMSIARVPVRLKHDNAAFLAACDPPTITALCNLASAAALPRPADGVGVRVKGLVWRENGSTSLWTGELIFGVYYTIHDEGTGWRVFRGQFLSDAGAAEVAYAASLEAAKAAAQADYDRRILAALDLAPAEPVAEDRLQAVAMAIYEGRLNRVRAAGHATLGTWETESEKLRQDVLAEARDVLNVILSAPPTHAEGRLAGIEEAAKVADDAAHECDKAYRGFTAFNAANFMLGKVSSLAARIRSLAKPQEEAGK